MYIDTNVCICVYIYVCIYKLKNEVRQLKRWKLDKVLHQNEFLVTNLHSESDTHLCKFCHSLT